MNVNIRLLQGIALMVGAFAFAQSACATTVTETYSFNLGNFVDTQGSFLPSNVIDLSGTFTVTFDPAVPVIDQVTGFTVDSFHAPGSGGAFASLPLVFTIAQPATLPGVDVLSIGGASVDGTSLVNGENDVEFFASFVDPGAPSMITCAQVPLDVCGAAFQGAFIGGYTLAAFPKDLWRPTTASVTVVPEPATLALVGIGFVGFGFLRKRQSI
ncbi:MAG: PEP-CTERM sorting domain-containing protein [Burkholderiales bacterium]|nr:PEP-CTERM sorting domain-containing protein [Burkholderiales bacterium]MDE2159749.1 PEP-CTERM sorting domain-containing protein [Burkholderiales bacterium]MDE2503011.1 PEP-CTERM sorting domain-containing protein [Burkholderiales bacterium]